MILRSLCVTVATVVGAMLPLAALQAQSYPSRPVKIVTPYAPGGASDILARTLAQKLSELWGQSAVVENKPGGNGVIGTEFVARAAPDGYTLELGTITTHVLVPILVSTLNYDPVRDFTPVALIANSPFVLVVNPATKVTSVAELIAAARAQPGKLNFGSSGLGTSNHLAGELFKVLAPADIVHVPYKGGTQSLGSLLQNETQILFDPLPSTALAQARAGKLTALATTGAKRSPAAPDLPTVAESGVPGFEAGAWYGIYAPAKLDPAIATKLGADINRAMAAPEVHDKLGSLGSEPVIATTDGLVALMR